MTPTVVVFLLARPLATAFGRYPNRSITSETFFLVAGFTLGFPFTTRDTVAIETFASRATSYIVILFIIFIPPFFSLFPFRKEIFFILLNQKNHMYGMYL